MSFKKTRILFICLTGFSMGMPGTAFAGADSGLYIGLGLGDAAVKASGTDPVRGGYSLDDSDSGIKLFGGYNFGLVPFLDLAVEGSYVDFGSTRGTFLDTSSFSVGVTGTNAFGLIGFDVGPVGLFAKAGLMYWRLGDTTNSSFNSSSGTDPAYGVGAKLQFGSFAVRAEYEVFEVDDLDDLSMVSVSAVYTF